MRETALDLLIKIEKKHAYSQLALNEALLNSNFSGRDKALVTQLVYGVLQRKLTLNYYLDSFVPRKRKIDDWIRLLLLLSIYQKVFLSRIPDHAIVNEAAKIAARRGHRGIVGFVNGVLRQFLRQGPPDLSAIEPEERRLSIVYSHPEWLIDFWSEAFGQKTAVAICEADNQAPRVTVRVNRLKTAPDRLADRLAGEGIQTAPGVLSPDALVITEGQAAASACFREGLMTIQDESSMLVAAAVSPQPGMNVLDACAGPGGKTTHLAEKMNNEGAVFALDLHEHKTKLIDEAAGRMGAAIIRTRVLDARRAGDVFEKESFDRILIDAPCSGLGVIRRKPEIKWEKEKSAVADLAAIQRDILESCAPLVKPGGLLVYSTCTIGKMENERQLLRFAAGHPEFSWDPDFFSRLPVPLHPAAEQSEGSMIQIFPFQFGTDGFFIGCLKKTVD